jgi:hypothetical protein
MAVTVIAQNTKRPSRQNQQAIIASTVRANCSCGGELITVGDSASATPKGVTF